MKEGGFGAFAGHLGVLASGGLAVCDCLWTSWLLCRACRNNCWEMKMAEPEGSAIILRWGDDSQPDYDGGRDVQRKYLRYGGWLPEMGIRGAVR